MPLSSDYVNSVAEVAKNDSILVHVDGARIFNAAVSLDISVAELTHEIDSVSFCLSKGLSAPAGSLLCGSEDFIYRARRNRKALGGGMRQAGILAAAGIVAIEKMTERIAEDHQNAKALAEGISCINGINIDLDKIQTNIIYFSLDHPKIESSLFLKKIGEKNIHFFELGPSWYRLVTHNGISKDDVSNVVEEFHQLLS